MIDSSLGQGGRVVTQMQQVVDKVCPAMYFDNFLLRLIFAVPSNVHAERCKKTKRKAVLFNKKKQMKVKKENGLKKNLKLTKKFVLQDGSINKAVKVSSNFLGAESSATAVRYNRKQRKHVQIKQPKVIKQYNNYIGGGDLADNMVANYRIDIRGKNGGGLFFQTILMSAL